MVEASDALGSPPPHPYHVGGLDLNVLDDNAKHVALDRWPLGLKIAMKQLGERSLNLLARYNPNHAPAGTPEGGQFTSDGGGGGPPPVGWEHPQAAAFIAARNRTSRPGYLSVLEPDDLADHRLYMNKDGTAGVAVDPQGDVQNVFNNGGGPGAGSDALAVAIRNGGRTLDCYDGRLPHIYAQQGFEEVARLKFNPDYANPGWDMAKDDSPDVIFMAWTGYPKGGSAASALKRAKGPRSEWITPKRTTNYVADYDAGQKASRDAAKPAHTRGAGNHRRYQGADGFGLGRSVHRTHALRGASDGRIAAGGWQGAGFQSLIRYNPYHVPAGSPEGGQFTSGDGGGGIGGGAAEPNPAVTEVGGDQWNKDTAARLEREYADAKPEVDKIAQEAAASGAEVDSSEDSPTTFEDLPDSVQQEAEQAYIDQNSDQELEYQQQSWMENDAPDQARTDLVEEFNNLTEADQMPDWVQERLDQVKQDREDDGSPPIPYTDDQLVLAMTIDEDGNIEFDDAKLQEPNNLGPAGQGTLPGIEAVDPADHLSHDMRVQLENEFKANWDKIVSDHIQNMEPPDASYFDISESLGESWDQMSDDDKWSWTQSNTSLIEDMASSGAGGTVSMPKRFDPLQDRPGSNDYAATQALARYVSTERALQILEERHITADPGAVRDADYSLWSDWKASSTSTGGKILQVAIADELGGRLSAKTADAIAKDAVIAQANDEYRALGGYEGVKAYVRAKWETTQYLLDKADTQVVDLYRAVGIPEKDLRTITHEPVQTIPGSPDLGVYQKLTSIELARNGAQSMTVDPGVANNWSSLGTYDNKRVVLRAEVPRTAVVSVPAYGINVTHEREVVVAGTAWKGWDAWENAAPSFDEVALTKMLAAILRAAKKPYVIDILQMEIDGNLPHWLKKPPPKKKPRTPRKPKPKAPKKGAKFNPYHVPAGSPEGGQFTSEGGGIEASGTEADAVASRWMEESPHHDLGAAMGAAKANQQALVSAAHDIQNETDAEFVNPGPKSEASARSKVARRGNDARKVTDLVRGGFKVESPAQADRVVKAIAKRFKVVDEGWKGTPAGYFDRALKVRFKDGQIGELQIWEPNLLAAKNGVGHKLYEQMRELKPGDSRLPGLMQQSRAAYSAAIGLAGEDWKRLAASLS